MDRDTTLAWLAEQLSQRLAEAVGGMAGATPGIIIAAGPGPLGEALWWQQGLTGLGDNALWLGAEETTWNRIGSEALAGAGIDDATLDDSRGTYLELLQQAISGLASALTARLGREVLPKDGKQLAPSAGGPGVNFSLELRGAPVGPLAVIWNPAMVEALLAATAAPASQPTPAQPSNALARTASADATDRYELLLDVEMPVSVSFGRAHLPLREIIKLTSGAIVELNRSVNEPVELIVNNCVVARGEVVVVDGNYGVRVKQIISRKERLRTLH